MAITSAYNRFPFLSYLRHRTTDKKEAYMCSVYFGPKYVLEKSKTVVQQGSKPRISAYI